MDNTRNPLFPRFSLSPHVTQIPLPTSTLPPESETNTYIVHQQGECLLVDAGAEDETVLQTVRHHLTDLGCTRVKGLIATHFHHDHTAGLPYLAKAFDAPIYLHPLDLPQAVAQWHAATENIVHDISILPAPSVLSVGSLQVSLEHHPGHTHGHLHVLIPEDETVLVGDHLSGFGTVWIGPPDGHLEPYYDALDRLIAQAYRNAGPGHGSAIADVKTAASRMKARRLAREQQILDLLLHTGPLSRAEIVFALYGDTIPSEAQWVAARTVQAHLQHLLTCAHILREYQASQGCFVYTRVGPGTHK